MFNSPDFYGLGGGGGPPITEASKGDQMDPMQNQQCRVCEEPAAGFHFGAFTCEGCKSFFGRTCNNQSVIQECKNNYRCTVDKKNRTACKACRLRKCLMVGMSKSGSRYGRRSNWFKIHCLMQNQQSHGGGSKRPHPPPPPLPSSTLHPSENPLPPTLSWAPLRPPLTRPPSIPFDPYSLLQRRLEEERHSIPHSPSPPSIFKSSHPPQLEEGSIRTPEENLPPPQIPLIESPEFRGGGGLFPFPPLYNPLSSLPPLYRLSPLLTASSLLSNPLLMFRHKSQLEILEEHRKLIQRFGIAAAVAEAKEKDLECEEKVVKLEDAIDLSYKQSSEESKLEEVAE